MLFNIPCMFVTSILPKNTIVNLGKLMKDYHSLKWDIWFSHIEYRHIPMVERLKTIHMDYVVTESYTYRQRETKCHIFMSVTIYVCREERGEYALPS